jgi:hypothetical protein
MLGWRCRSDAWPPTCLPREASHTMIPVCYVCPPWIYSTSSLCLPFDDPGLSVNLACCRVASLFHAWQPATNQLAREHGSYAAHKQSEGLEFLDSNWSGGPCGRKGISIFQGLASSMNVIIATILQEADNWASAGRRGGQRLAPQTTWIWLKWLQVVPSVVFSSSSSVFACSSCSFWTRDPCTILLY